jgi:hypothetical protein
VLGAAKSNDLHLRHFSREHMGTHMPKSAMTMSNDGSFVRKKMFSCLSSATCYTQITGEWRRDVHEMPVSDVMIVHVLHAGQDRTGRKELIVSLVCSMRRGAYLSIWLKTVHIY